MSTISRVKRIMETQPDTRDSNNLLTIAVWKEDLAKIESESPVDILELFADGRITNPNSIRRYRQMIERDHPHLRGEEYKKRHTTEEERVREAVKQPVR